MHPCFGHANLQRTIVQNAVVCHKICKFTNKSISQEKIRYMKRFNLVLVLTLVLQTAIFAQAPVIWTVNGDSIIAREVSYFQDTATKVVQYLTVRLKWQDIERQEIFSIKLADESMHYLYQPIFEGDRNLEQMNKYIEGHRTGYKGSKRGAFLIGFAGGALAMALPPDKMFVAPLFPLTAIICVGKFSPTRMPSNMDEHFMEGYRHRRKAQNVKSAVWGGLSGLLVGAAGSFLIYGWGI